MTCAERGHHDGRRVFTNEALLSDKVPYECVDCGERTSITVYLFGPDTIRWKAAA